MTRRPWIRFAFLTTATLVAGIAASGCNGGTTPPVLDDGGQRPGGNDDGGGGGGTKDGAKPSLADARPTFEAPPEAPPPPPPTPDAVLIVPGRARLVGTHFSACSNAVPASGNGDRWCAFTLPNRQIGFTDLWVINVTKALAGAPPKCDGTDPNCLLMVPMGSTNGTQLWTGQPMQGPIHPTTHRFDGDTLIFHALAPDNLDQYEGPIFAWRPGWGAPKKISGDKAYSCSAHFTAETFVCIENLSTTMPLQFDLTGGKLAAPAQLIKHIIPFRAGTMTSQWRAALTRDGSTIAFSTGGLTTTDRETIYYAKFDAPTQVTMAKAGASRWSISADGTKYYYLANYNYDTMGAPAGTLTMADFPSGANEVILAPMVGAAQVLAEGDVDKGVGFFDSVIAGKATYKIMRDRNNRTAITTVVTNIGGVLAISRDMKYLYYYKDFDQDNGVTTDSWIVKTDGSQAMTGGCSLTTTLESDQFGAPFTRSGQLVFWADNIDQIDGVGEGWVATPEGCANRRKFSDKMDFWFLHGDDGMVFSDEGVLDYATLKHVTFPGGNTVGSPTLVQKQVNRIYAIVPNFESIIFTIVNSAAANDGLYSYAKVPFKGPVRDAGM
jgi:hypothetical protein